MNRRILVTGGSGFIGSFLVEELIRHGAEVHCMLLPDDPATNLAAVRHRLHIHRADLVDLDTVRRVTEAARPEAVFHLAAAGVTNVQADVAMVSRVNIEGTLNLLTALDGNYRVFVNTGTCHEYGSNDPPFREDQAPKPELPYAITKTAAWHFCNRFHRTEGWPIVTVRPFSVYGPRQAANTFVPACILAARSGRGFDMTLGEQKRDFVYVGDIVRGFIRAAAVPEAIGSTFNLCTGQETMIYDVARSIVEQMNSPVTINRGALPYRRDEIWRLVGDNSRARDVLGWEPQVPLEEGINRTIRYYSGSEGP